MTYPDFSSGEVLTSSDMDRIGLWRITRVTIGNAVSSVTVSNCFSSDFDNYKILVNGSAGSTNNNLAMTLNGGTTGYYGVLIYALTTGAAPLLATNNNASEWSFVGYNTTDSGIIMTMEILGPNLAEWTGIQSSYISPGGGGQYTGSRQATTQHTGFTLTPASGTMTGGTITVYGYNKNS